MAGTRTLKLFVVLSACVLLLPGFDPGPEQQRHRRRREDSSGAVLPGVTVEAASPALIEKVRTAVTDGAGQYQDRRLASRVLHASRSRSPASARSSGRGSS